MKKLCLAFAAALLAGCASGPHIDTTYFSQQHRSRVQWLIIHYTALDFPTSLRVLTQQRVSSHYLVGDRPATIYRLVDEDRSAYHAGLSSWQGYTNLNDSSIGIEIVNLGYEGAPPNRTWPEYPPEQVEAVVALVKKIVAEHGIRPDRILGHSDIAPQRKTDPGPKFPWKRLADEGLITWPDAARVASRVPIHEALLPDVLWFQDRLAQHGFAVPKNGVLDGPTRRVVSAFQMKYRPAVFDGTPDAETAALLEVLTSP